MTATISRAVLFFLLLGYFSHGFSGGSSTKTTESTEEVALVGNSVAGEERYKKSCVNCHGAGGKGVASYPKIAGQELPYTISKLETYRDGIKIGPNSSLMIMMAKPLTDQEIADLAVYLRDVTSQ